MDTARAQGTGELLSAAECRALAGEVLSFSRADEAGVELAESEVLHLRFARNTLSHCARVRTRTVSVRSAFGTRSAAAQANQLDRAALEALVRRSEELARLVPADPEFVPALGAQVYAAAADGAARDEEESVALLASGACGCVDQARALGLLAAGYVESTRSARATANTAGLFGYQRASEAFFSETARTSDGRGSGWASTAGKRAAELDFEAVSRAACKKARDSAGARPLATGAYPAVLEADCTASLLALFAQALDARSADEGRSFAALADGKTRLGEALAPGWLTLRSDPAHARVPTSPWGADGVPHRATSWIDAGRLAALHCGRFWAGKSGREARPAPPNLLLEGGAGGASELVKNLERGLLITSFWYLRAVDPRTLLYTGLTRDGVFWVENGEVRHPVTNFRWNESPLRVLSGALEAGAPVRVGGRGGESRTCYVPPLRVASFTLTGVSEAV